MTSRELIGGKWLKIFLSKLKSSDTPYLLTAPPPPGGRTEQYPISIIQIGPYGKVSPNLTVSCRVTGSAGTMWRDLPNATPDLNADLHQVAASFDLYESVISFPVAFTKGLGATTTTPPQHPLHLPTADQSPWMSRCEKPDRTLSPHMSIVA